MNLLSALALIWLAAGTDSSDCPPPDLTRSAAAGESRFLHVPPFLALENPVEDPVVESPADVRIIREILTRRLEELSTAKAAESKALPAAPPGTRWLFSHASGWLLVPEHLELTVAAVGVDGSWLLEMSDAEGTLHLRATSTGSCLGCAMSEAALWFPEQVEAARDNEFLLCERHAPAPEILSRSASRVRWQRKDPGSGAELQGVVADMTGEGEGLRILTVSGLPPAITEAVLDGFTP